MAAEPVILLSAPALGERTGAQPGGSKIEGPGPNRQRDRIGPAISRVESTFERLRASSTPSALDVECILVMSVAGSIRDFGKTLQRISGLEFLGHQVLQDVDEEEVEEFAAISRDGRASPPTRELYLLASDWSAWKQLLVAWQRFQSGARPKRGYTSLVRLFEQLVSLREWSDLDRLREAGAAEEWRRTMASHGNAQVAFEVEFWFRHDIARRDEAERMLGEGLLAQGGSLERAVTVPEIQYHGAIGYAPAARLLEAAETLKVDWISTEGVRFFRAAGQVACPSPAPDATRRPRFAPRLALPDGPTRVALLDGVPQLGHEALDNLIRFDDPDGKAETVPVARRRHGTAMASLILHGEPMERGPSGHETIYSRPILTPSEWGNASESIPSGELPVGVIHEAVARLFEGNNPAAPETKVIVLAIGDPSQRFHQFVSPVARLLDWLAWKYKVLFLVSAGNHVGDIEIDRDVDLADAASTQAAFLRSLVSSALSRRLFAPAEAVNVLTIGAAHSDQSGAPAPASLIEPIYNPELPNVVGPVASGVGRSVKPEVLFPGGRQLVQEEPPEVEGRMRRVSVAAGDHAPGIEVASPGVGAEYVFWSGTSMATGLAGHSALDVLRQIDDLRGRYESFPDSALDALVVRASIVHTAAWGSAHASVREALLSAGLPARREHVGRILGFGRAEPANALRGAPSRAVMLSAGEIGKDQLHTFDIPLPQALSAVRLRRRLAITLAWFCPVRPEAHSAYRRTVLELGVTAGTGAPFGERYEADQRAAGRGTVRHEVFETERAVPIRDGATERVTVGCRTTTDEGLESPVPYAILISMETPDDVTVPIYEQVRQAVPTRVTPAIPVPAPR